MNYVRSPVRARFGIGRVNWFRQSSAFQAIQRSVANRILMMPILTINARMRVVRKAFESNVNLFMTNPLLLDRDTNQYTT